MCHTHLSYLPDRCAWPMVNKQRTLADGGRNISNVGTKGLLFGFIALNLLLHQSFIRGIGGPEGASQLVMWVAVIGIVTYPIMDQGIELGYWLIVLTGLLGLGVLAIIGLGVLGPMNTEGPLIGLILGPVAYGVFSLLLIVVGYSKSRSGSISSL